MENKADILMRSGVTAVCTDCGDERIFIEVEETGAFCCTSCDAAVFLLQVVGAVVPEHRDVA